MTFSDCSFYCTMKRICNWTRHVIVRSGGCSGGGSSDVSRRGGHAVRGELEIELELELGITAAEWWLVTWSGDTGSALEPTVQRLTVWSFYI